MGSLRVKRLAVGPLWHTHQHLIVKLVRIGCVLPLLLLLLTSLGGWHEFSFALKASVVGEVRERCQPKCKTIGRRAHLHDTVELDLLLSEVSQHLQMASLKAVFKT